MIRPKAVEQLLNGPCVDIAVSTAVPKANNELLTLTIRSCKHNTNILSHFKLIWQNGVVFLAS